MAETKKKPAAKSTSKKTCKAKPTTKKLSVTIDKELYTAMEEYLQEYGYSKDEFVKKAIAEKVSREKISTMIDDMIKL